MAIDPINVKFSKPFTGHRPKGQFSNKQSSKGAQSREVGTLDIFQISNYIYGMAHHQGWSSIAGFNKQRSTLNEPCYIHIACH